ncbi:MAG: glutamine-hydrolyzing GMP synthase, partial [Ruminococcus sp.]|nr:glutamine-hydrolyzing GMP synthase [Ruminococcus sp.]
MNQVKEKILVLDFGGQYNQLIARRVRDHNVYAEIKPYTTSLDEIKAENYKGIIFTGGPNSVYDMSSPHYDKEILNLGIPVLGICYGCQLICWMRGGKVETSETREYGKIDITVDKKDGLLFKNIPDSVVWMSHTDKIVEVPDGFEVTAHSDNCPVAAMENAAENIYAVQFHPEVTHSEYGNELLYNFIFNVCKCKGDWKMEG